MTCALVTRTFRQTHRFIGGHQTPGTGFVGQASFVATTPTLILDSGSSKGIVIARLVISQLVAGGADTHMVLATDLKNRYASGGGAVASVNSNREDSRTATATLYGGEPTAAAAGANVYYFEERLIDNSAGRTDEINWPDGIILPPSASFLAYFYNGTSDATLGLTIEWLEV